MNVNLHDTVVSAILDADRSLANKLIDDWAAVHGYDKAVVEVVSPVLERIGRMWQDVGEFSLAQAYVAAKVAEDALAKMLSDRDSIAKEMVSKGPLVIGNVEDDYHPMGKKMVVAFLRISGWETYDLGIDVLPEEFVDKALDVGARVIGASAMMYTTAMNIQKLREEIDKRGLTRHLKLAVGGAVFKLRPDLVEEVGADGTAENAINAATLMAELWNISLRNGEE